MRMARLAKAATRQEKLQRLGLEFEASNRLMAIILEIERSGTPGTPQAPNDVSRRIGLARTAFFACIDVSDDINEWERSARRAAGL